MDMFNKLKSSLSGTVANTITNTVYNTGTIISGVLPGNPVTRDYEVVAHIASAGPGLMWKIYSGVKKSTRQPASVFVFERAMLDRFDKQEKDIIWDLMKKGVSQLTRLRHPQILTVQHPLEESRDCLAFATEPVFASLANTLGQHENLPSPVPADLRSFKMFDVEIKYGLLQISEGLEFLHGSAKMLHRNISPESIVINEQGAWKICGFEYCLPNIGPPGQAPSWEFPEYDHSQPPESYPHLDYTAPEYALLGGVTAAADMFSYGMLAVAIYNKKPLFQNNRNWGVFKRNAVELKSIPPLRLQDIPADLREYLKLLLSTTPDLRPSPDQLQQLPYFDDFGVKTLTNLDSQFQWDNLQKSQFYKGLPTILPKLPPRVALHRVYPCLAKEFVNHDMVPFVLPSALQIAEQASNEDFVRHILPSLKPVMKIMEPIQILLVFMQRMDLLLEKTPAEDVKTDVLPMVYRALESNVSQIQELCLSIIPNFAGLLDRQSLKSALLPKIRTLCTSTTLLSVRVNSLICIGKLLEHMDKWQVIDDVLPWLPHIPSKEPAVIMAIVGIFKLAFTNSKLGLTKEVMANKVLPFLIPLSIENGLTVQQFNSISSIIREMLGRVETEHRTKLEQLNSIQDSQKSTLKVGLSESLTLPPGQLVAAPTAQEVSTMDSMFDGLGLGNYVNQDKSKLVNKMIGDNNNHSKNEINIPKSTSSHSLSLQEKQRILAEQESAQNRPASKSPTPSKPMDLTNSLINKSMSMNQISANPTTWNNSNNSSNWHNGGMGSLGAGGGGNLGMSQASSNNASPGFGNFNQSASFSSLNHQQSTKPDLSAFDSLMGGPVQPKQPMNAMQGPMGIRPIQPMMPSNPNQLNRQQNQPQAKPLSFNEINDFLS